MFFRNQPINPMMDAIVLGIEELFSNLLGIQQLSVAMRRRPDEIEAFIGRWDAELTFGAEQGEVFKRRTMDLSENLTAKDKKFLEKFFSLTLYRSNVNISTAAPQTDKASPLPVFLLPLCFIVFDFYVVWVVDSGLFHIQYDSLKIPENNNRNFPGFTISLSDCNMIDQRFGHTSR